MTSLASQAATSKTSGSSVPLFLSPSVRKALGELGVLLDDYHYSPHARDAILAYVAREGTPTGCPYLDAGDEHDAEMVFVAELEPVPFESEAWDRDQSVIFDVELLAAGTHPWPIPTVCDDDRAEPAGSGTIPFGRSGVWMPPISGGSGEAEPFEPSPEDLADYAAWCADLAARGDFPRPKTAADRLRDQADVAAFYMLSPDA